MVRKAHLDEIDFDLPPEDDEQPPGGDDEEGKRKASDGGDDQEDGEQEESRFAFLGEKTRLVIFCILGCLLIVGAVWGTWYFVKKGKQQPSSAENMANVKTQEQKETISPASPEIIPTNQVLFQGFMIPLPEEAKFRLLEVSFAVELVVVEGKGVQKGDISNDPGVRRQIINAIQSHGRDLMPTKNSRALVKNDLLNLMTQIYGENVVKNVYVTNFTFI